MDFNSNIVSLDGIRIYADVVFGQEVIIYCSFPMIFYSSEYFSNLKKLGTVVSLITNDDCQYRVVVMEVDIYQDQIRCNLIKYVSDWREDGF